MKKPIFKLKTVLATSVLTTMACSTAMASGFRVPEVSTLGTGTANALVANTREAGALAYNPAAMSFHDKSTFVIGATFVAFDLSATPTGGSKTDSEGKDLITIPNVYLHQKINSTWDFGLAINAPFGLETKWPAGTFPTFSALGADAFHPTYSRIEMLNVNPNVAYKFNQNGSFAFGIDWYNVRELNFNTQGVAICCGFSNSLGWNVGFMYQIQNWNLGLSYRSSVKADLSGALYPPGLGPIPPSAASGTIEFPDMLQLGIAWQISPAWGIEFDVDRTGWSSFDKLEIESGFIPTVTSTNNWKDAWAYRLGAIWQINPKNQLRLGYALDETGQTDEWFSARVPDANRQLFSIGYAYNLGAWQLEAGYMYVLFDDRTINQPAGSYAARLGAGDTDPNGTDAYNGLYETTVHLLSVGANYKF